MSEPDKLYPEIQPETNAESKIPCQEQVVQETTSTESKSSTSFWLDASWASSLVNTAKEKTKTTIETMKKDIHEISDTLHHGANTLATETVKRAQIIQQMIAPTPDSKEKTQLEEEIAPSEGLKTPTSNPPAGIDENLNSKGNASGGSGNIFGMGWMKQVVETVHKFATEDTTKDEDEYTEAIRVGPGGRRSLLDQCTLLQIQNDPRTFLQPPQQNVDLYKEWLNEFKIVEYNGEINMLLGYNHRLREIYAELVPSQVENNTFWNRYFFKVHLKELDKQILSGGETGGGTAALKLHMENKVGGSSGHSPAPSNGKDDWSMCSSGVTTEAEDCENGANEREDASTPRPQKQVKNVDNDGDEWDECEDEVATAGKGTVPAKTK